MEETVSARVPTEIVIFYKAPPCFAPNLVTRMSVLRYWLDNECLFAKTQWSPFHLDIDCFFKIFYSLNKIRLQTVLMSFDTLIVFLLLHSFHAIGSAS